MMVHFPWLHPGLVHGPLPEGVVLFDPGVALSSEFSRWRPADLPLEESEVRRLVREYVNFAGELRRPSDMRPYERGGLEDFYTDTGMDIRSRLRDGGNAEARPAEDRRRQAQIVLALALSSEEQFAALLGEEGRLARARSGFAASLGLDEDDAFADQGVPDALVFPRPASDLPWKDMLGPLLEFTPAGVRFFVSDPDVARELLALNPPREVCGTDGELVCLRVSLRDLNPSGREDVSAVIALRPTNPNQ